MEIVKSKDGQSLTIALKGRLDTSTAPQLEEVINNDLQEIVDLTLDLSDLEYVSSAGLRMFLAAQKIMNAKGKMVIKNANEGIKEVFEITGFIDILTIE